MTGMSGRAQLMWDEAVTGYDFGSGHPMDPVRLALTMRLVEAFELDREAPGGGRGQARRGLHPAAGAP